MGRPVLSAGEILRMGYVDGVIHSYSSRAKSENWVAWANQYPTEAKDLLEVERLAKLMYPEDE